MDTRIFRKVLKRTSIPSFPNKPGCLGRTCLISGEPTFFDALYLPEHLLSSRDDEQSNSWGDDSGSDSSSDEGGKNNEPLKYRN
jgi:hypothetical protein